MDSSPFLGLGDQTLTSQQQQQQESPSSSAPVISHQQTPEDSSNKNASTSKRNSKQKSKEGSSLLHVFTNPLLHAIPMLARNCLNFEDFLTQAAIQGQHGLLGSKNDNSNNNEFTTPDNLMLGPTGDKSRVLTKLECPWHVKVLGLPSSGAKSRVETQIKVVLQLSNSAGDLATNWTHLKLPEHMVARDKLKRRNQNKNGDGGGDTQANDVAPALAETQVLKLEAAVVCDGNADNEIIMCSSCVHRERKRMKRKRDNKVARAANKEGGAAKLAALFANDLPDLTNETVMAEERKKILLFNCSEYIEFNNGEVTLPTRVTCYCRHHSEKVGFRIVFTVKDCHNHVLGTGRSPPIMITDDHKSSKAQSTTPAPQPAPPANRKRSRNEEGLVDMKPPALQKRKMPTNTEAETDSVISSPVTSTPATPLSNIEEPPSTPLRQRDSVSRSPSVFDNQSLIANTGHQRKHQLDTSQEKPSNDYITHLQTTPQNSNSPSALVDNLQQGDLFEFLNSDNMNMDQLMPMTSTGNLQQPVPPHHHQQLPYPQTQSQHQMMSMMQQLSHMPQSSIHNVLNRRHPVVTTNTPHSHQQQPTHVNNNTTTTTSSSSSSNNNDSSGNAQSVYSKMFQQRQTTENSNKNNLPRLHRLIPSEGPIYGGSEVTVLGSNFYEGLTCLFGENPAVPTHCWSANTLLCILPPATTAGPVVVSFKEHPLMLEGQDVVLFTYFDESDRALMELALQVVGLKTMGKVEDARQIAMRIVQGDGNNQGRKNDNRGANSTTSTTTTTGTQRLSYRQFLTTKAAQATYDNARMLFYSQLEEQIIAALMAASTLSGTSRLWTENCISLTNRSKHTLLHLAVIRGYSRLVRILVHLKCNVNQVDRNGFTALHFASWTGKMAMVKMLLDKTDWRMETVNGKTALQLAQDAGHHGVVALFDKRAQEQHMEKSFALITSRHKPSISDVSMVSTSSSKVRVPLIDILPSSAAVSSVKSILPDKLFNMLSSIYVTSANTPCIQQFGQSVSTVYTSMLDPF
ncbi:unnamed protein product [Absidia cylindrospora]